MEFGWAQDERTHRERVRAVLKGMLPPDWETIAVHGPGSREQTTFSKTLCARLAQEHLLIPNWPKEFGGDDETVWRQFIMAEELWAIGEPRGPQYMNINWVGPVIMRFGTRAQIDKYLPPIRAGQAIWCQGFSEPSAGSDLAALRTSAVSVEGGYSVTGTKVWTSYAGFADTCFLLARIPSANDSSQNKAAIVILLVDMRYPRSVLRQCICGRRRASRCRRAGLGDHTIPASA
jgi:alkylation response protein AidB-like acyl-CoA dehydrogenase